MDDGSRCHDGVRNTLIAEISACAARPPPRCPLPPHPQGRRFGAAVAELQTLTDAELVARATRARGGDGMR